MPLKKAPHEPLAGRQHAELHGVNEGQIRRASRWNNDELTSSYLTHPPCKFTRSMTGFAPSLQGVVFLTRARILPRRSLEQAV